MTTLQLIRAYSAGSAGLVFRLRQRSVYHALERRLRQGAKTRRR